MGSVDTSAIETLICLVRNPIPCLRYLQIAVVDRLEVFLGGPMEHDGHRCPSGAALREHATHAARKGGSNRLAADQGRSSSHAAICLRCKRFGRQCHWWWRRRGGSTVVGDCLALFLISPPTLQRRCGDLPVGHF